MAAAAMAEEEYDASGMLQAQRSVKRHHSARHMQVWEDKASDMMCIPAFAGDRAPIVGHFTAEGQAKSQLVRVGDIAPTGGKFCVESGTMSLLQRSLGFNSGAEVESALVAKGDVEGATGNKDVEGTTGGKTPATAEPKFALEELGPFRLKQIPDIQLQANFDKRTYSARDGAVSGAFALGRTEPLDSKGSNYWLGASKVDWAYQVTQTEANSDESTSFEKFGGFILHGANGADGELALEIDGDVADPLMTMNFGEPFVISKSEWTSCTDHLTGGPMDGPAKITIPFLLQKGALEYCWETNHKECERGCFMYHTKYGYQAFAVLDFAMHSLGPFPLVGRPDLVPSNYRRDEWMAELEERNSAATLQVSSLEKLGSDYWLGAKEVDWIYQTSAAASGKSFEDFGGFILVGGDGEAPVVTQALEIEIGATKPVMTLQFEEPHHIAEAEWNSCQNPAEITIDALSNLGAQNYCWHVSPGKCERGCFIYKTTNGYQGFAVKSYALEKLGPFPLYERRDLSVGKQADSDSYTLDGLTGKLGSTLPLTVWYAKDFWGANEVDWAYQVNPDSARSFEAYGGFLLLDAAGTVTRTMQIGKAEDLDAEALENMDEWKTLNFGSPFHITEERWNECKNPQAITITFLADQGAQQYCWAVDEKQCDFGCFLYKTTEGYQGFPVEHTIG